MRASPWSANATPRAPITARPAEPTGDRDNPRREPEIEGEDEREAGGEKGRERGDEAVEDLGCRQSRRRGKGARRRRACIDPQESFKGLAHRVAIRPVIARAQGDHREKGYQ